MEKTTKIEVNPDTKIETLNPTIIEAIKAGKSSDEIMKLFDVHGTECEVYSRVVGFFRPVKMWNAGKQEEYKDRVEFDPKIFPKEVEQNASTIAETNQS